MNKYYEKLVPYIEKGTAIQTSLTLFEWDDATKAPEEASEYTSKVVGILSDEYYRTFINDEVKELLKKLQGKKEQESLSEKEKAIVKELVRIDEELRPIPVNEYKDFATLKAKSSRVWEKAKKENDYKKFAPVLKEIIAYQKKFAGYRRKKKEKTYDILLNDFEPGFTMEVLDDFFTKIKEELVPLMKEVSERNDRIDKMYNHAKYPIEKQKEFCEYLAAYLGFNFNRGVISESVHPFTTNFHNHDVRITTSYLEEDLEDAMFSTIHETGHALYEQGISDELTLSPVGTGTSMGVHESQSRFYENMIGKTESFWKPLYPKLVDKYPEQLKNVSLADFIKGINKAVPGLIRTQADELTYPLHILVRYEMEKAIFEENADVDNLSNMWNQKYKEYLGVEPKSDSEGILQDIHWSMGEFGYFPSYAIGSALAAQVYHYMKSVMPIDKYLEEENLVPIREYLRDHIHQYGKTKTTNELLKDMMNEEFNPEYYTKYLKEKYRKLYGLN